MYRVAHVTGAGLTSHLIVALKKAALEKSNFLCLLAFSNAIQFSIYNFPEHLPKQR